MIGDLIFVHDKGFSAWLIRFWTRRGAPQDFPQGLNHVAICVGLDRWLSAEPTGIKERTTKWLLRNASGYVVLRYEGRPIAIADQARIDKAPVVAATWAKKLAEGRPYDFLGIVGFVLHRLLNIKVDWGNKWFCSELCCEAYLRAFDELGIPHSYRDPADTTPNDLYKWAKANGFRVVATLETGK